MGCTAPYKLGRNTSVIPASNFKNVCPPSPVVNTLSCTVLTNAPAIATRNVPGSISSFNSLPPFSSLNSRKACATGSPTSCRSVLGSPGLRPTLYPPPKFNAVTVSNTLQKLRDDFATCCQISGSLPEPMWVCILSTTNEYFFTMSGTVPSETSSCHIPKDDDGPPTFVFENDVVDFENPPDPTPGLIRIPTLPPGIAAPNRSNCDTEHALIFTPSATSSAKSDGNSCVLSEIFSAGIPAAMARLTSYPEDASTCIPMLWKIDRSAAFGQAFMA
mmetsp:Transcript_34272/g.41978  ORF Transcript_34272/g.41978 Transcript_34272/m.41978 type:complete len:274 (+) Transcript_34272:446-1267(+)